MKATDQVSKTVKDLKVPGKTKPASRKAGASAKRASSPAAKRGPKRQSNFAGGYSDSASRLIARGKTAFGNAYAWAGEASHSLPRSARDLGLPDQRSLKAMIDDRPLIIGAVGLGIGVALGSMLPTVGSLTHRAKPAASRKARRH